MRLEKVGRAIVMWAANNGCGVVLLDESGRRGLVIMGEATEAKVDGGIAVFREFVLANEEDGTLPTLHAGRPDLHHIGIGIPTRLFRFVRCLETDAVEVVAAAVV